MKKYINLGCGQSPASGFENYDGSPAVFLGRFPRVAGLLSRARLIGASQYAYACFCAEHGIRYADVCKLPFPDHSVHGIYACHVSEHLNRRDFAIMINEAKRCLVSGGWIRLAVPDLKKMALTYLESGDADRFVSDTCFAGVWDKLGTFQGRLQTVIWGQPSCHKWMYDGASLASRLVAAGFVNVAVLNAGETTIPDSLSLDLNERAYDSVYVEAYMP